MEDEINRTLNTCEFQSIRTILRKFYDSTMLENATNQIYSLIFQGVRLVIKPEPPRDQHMLWRVKHLILMQKS